MGGSSAPKPDPKMGEAALLSAQTGQDMLAWMRDQAEITNAWADEDRARYQNVFQPLEDQYIAEAQAYDTPGRRSARANAAAADVRQAFDTQADIRRRDQMRYGVRPDSGAFREAERRTGNEEALAVAGARNLSNRRVEAEGRELKANAVNMGRGLGVNPATSMSLSNNAGGSGFQGAMSGYGQQANILNQDFQNRMSSWQSNMGGLQGLMSGVGMALGASGILPLSSKEAKTDKEPLPDGAALGAVKEMPGEKWRYKEGQGYDQGAAEHVGPYAEDFTAETGSGDGQRLNVADAVGVALGAIKDLAKEVDQLKGAAA